MEKKHEQVKIEFKGVTMPRMDGIFLAIPKEQKFEQFLRLETLIIDDYNFKILFGIKLVSHEKVEDAAKVDVIVELMGDFTIDKPIPKCQKITEIPCLPNMAAMMFPFLREKIYSFLLANNYTLLLSSVNFYDFIKDAEGKPGFSVTDDRQNKQLEMEAVN